MTRGAALRPALLARAWGRDRAKLAGLARLLTSLDPRALLARGYAMVRDADGAIVPSAVRARGAGHLRLAFADGEILVTVADGGAPPPLHPPLRRHQSPRASPRRAGAGTGRAVLSAAGVAEIAQVAILHPISWTF